MKAIILFVSMFLTASAVVAQQPPQPAQPGHPGQPRRAPHPPNAPGQPNQPSPPNHDPLAHLMFPPDMIMNHARQLSLTDEQKTFMRGEIQRTTASFQELQWKLHDQMELLHETMKATSVNEQQALAQLEKVLELERDIKRLHIGLAVRLKNRLTPEQQEALHKMRSGFHPPIPPGP